MLVLPVKASGVYSCPFFGWPAGELDNGINVAQTRPFPSHFNSCSVF